MLFQKVYNKNAQTDRKNKKVIKERKRSPWYFRTLFPPTDRVNPCLSEKVSFCASQIKKASIAVETVLVLPLFFLGMITMISFMDIYRIQTEHFQSLCEKAMEAGMYAYVADSRGPQEITLPDVYSYTPVGGMIPLPKVWMHNTVKVHAWTGASGKKGYGDVSEKKPEEMVYVTETGSVYHKNAGCHYLNLSLDQVPGSSVGSLRNHYGEKYAPCESCSLNQKPAGSVYITGTGNRYHNLETCSRLKRTAKLVKKSQVSGMHACSRCG